MMVMTKLCCVKREVLESTKLVKKEKTTGKPNAKPLTAFLIGSCLSQNSEKERAKHSLERGKHSFFALPNPLSCSVMNEIGLNQERKDSITVNSGTLFTRHVNRLIPTNFKLSI